MRLESIGRLAYGDQISRLKKQENEKSSSSKNGKLKIVRRDTYTPSSTAKKLKANNLDEVRKRVKSGFYNSEVVNNDLTDALSKIIDTDN